MGIETDRGLLVASLVAAGYQVYAINPKAVDRYRDRHSVSGAKSDRGDAKVLADMVRTDRHNHRRIAGDSDLAEAIKVTARAHQNLIWTRQRQINQLRSALREFYSPLAHGSEMASGLGIRLSGRRPFRAHVPGYVLGVSQMRREAVYCRLLHRRGDVAVDVHRRGDRGVPEPLLHHLRVLPEFQ
ncbi:MAG: transposase, partial [Euzebyaceae bacterium]|nr:transposase [Euzebyaceae bacterium]